MRRGARIRSRSVLALGSQTAVSLGGKIIASPTEVTGVGRVALLKDPSGVTFALVARA